jgi:hypothetical protein
VASNPNNKDESGRGGCNAGPLTPERHRVETKLMGTSSLIMKQRIISVIPAKFVLDPIEERESRRAWHHSNTGYPLSRV